MNTKKNGGELLFSNRDLRQLIFPLIVEQILAVSVGMVDTRCVLGKVWAVLIPGETKDTQGNVTDPRDWSRIGMVS